MTAKLILFGILGLPFYVSAVVSEAPPPGATIRANPEIIASRTDTKDVNSCRSLLLNAGGSPQILRSDLDFTVNRVGPMHVQAFYRLVHHPDVLKTHERLRVDQIAAVIIQNGQLREGDRLTEMLGIFSRTGTLIGLISVVMQTGHFTAFGFIVDPEFWGNGLGRRAGQEVINRILASPSHFSKTLIASVRADNIAAIKSLKNLGFVIRPEPRFQFEDLPNPSAGPKIIMTRTP